MGTKDTHQDIAGVLFGKTRRAVLGLLFLHPERSYYVREIVRSAGVGHGAVQRELEQLSEAGIIHREQRGRQVHYQANDDCAVYQELRSLVVKTAGMADVLRDALAPVTNRIKVAFVYGSMASGQDDGASDIDLMVIGDVEFTELVCQLQEPQEELDREINPTVYHAEEFRQKVAADHHFVRRVTEGPKIFLIGDDDELTAVAG